MFDIGFSEILLIFVLALVVLGPERLPKVVREVGRWVGRARAMARQFQEQLEEEVDVDRSARPSYTEPPAAQPHPQAPGASLAEATPAADEPAPQDSQAPGTAHPNPSTHEQGT